MLIQDSLVLFETFKRLLFPNSVSWFRLFYHFLQQAGSKESSVTEYLNTQISPAGVEGHIKRARHQLFLFRDSRLRLKDNK